MKNRGLCPHLEFIAFVFPKTDSYIIRFSTKIIQPLRSHSCVALSCCMIKPNYIIIYYLDNYTIYTLKKTLPCIIYMYLVIIFCLIIEIVNYDIRGGYYEFILNYARTPKTDIFSILSII